MVYASYFMITQLLSFQLPPRILKLWLREKNYKTLHILVTKTAIIGEIKKHFPYFLRVFFGEI